VAAENPAAGISPPPRLAETQPCRGLARPWVGFGATGTPRTAPGRRCPSHRIPDEGKAQGRHGVISSQLAAPPPRGYVLRECPQGCQETILEGDQCESCSISECVGGLCFMAAWAWVSRSTSVFGSAGTTAPSIGVRRRGIWPGVWNTFQEPLLRAIQLVKPQGKTHIARKLLTAAVQRSELHNPLTTGWTDEPHDGQLTQHQQYDRRLLWGTVGRQAHTSQPSYP